MKGRRTLCSRATRSSQILNAWSKGAGSGGHKCLASCDASSRFALKHCPNQKFPTNQPVVANSYSKPADGFRPALGLPAFLEEPAAEDLRRTPERRPNSISAANPTSNCCTAMHPSLEIREGVKHVLSHQFQLWAGASHPGPLAPCESVGFMFRTPVWVCILFGTH